MSAPAPHAEIWNSLFTTYSIAAIVLSGFVFAVLVYFLAKYKERPGLDDQGETFQIGKDPKRGSPKVTIALVVILAILFFGLTLSTFSALDFMEHLPEDNPDTLHIKVLAFQWGWKFTYPNGKTITGELRVPVGRPVILEITSQDVFHTFAIPAFKVKRDAIPGRINFAWFEAKESGMFSIRCYELCGTGHAEMLATLLVMEPEQFEIWFEEFSRR